MRELKKSYSRAEIKANQHQHNDTTMTTKLTNSNVWREENKLGHAPALNTNENLKKKLK